ncbi:Short-chain dehydrogenase/reductase SDR [Penicillium tannophilum]|nr:Short-chain dehydrogenase/reductase SDR [Penicillium tannophilum]
MVTGASANGVYPVWVAFKNSSFVFDKTKRIWCDKIIWVVYQAHVLEDVDLYNVLSPSIYTVKTDIKVEAFYLSHEEWAEFMPAKSLLVFDRSVNFEVVMEGTAYLHAG